MKKVITILLVIVLVFSLFACGSNGETTATEEEAPVAISDSEGATESQEKTDVPETPEATNAPENESSASEIAYTISDEVIVDDENCIFKITKAEVDSIWGFTLKAYCENKTPDKTLMKLLPGKSQMTLSLFLHPLSKTSELLQPTRSYSHYESMTLMTGVQMIL